MIKGHIRKKANTSKNKTVCLDCECLVGNCLSGCSKQNVYGVYRSFRPPKRGSKDWKELKTFLSINAFFDTVGGKYSPVFGSHGVGIKKAGWCKSLYEKAYRDVVTGIVQSRKNPCALSKKEKRTFR